MELKNIFVKYIKLREKLDKGKIYKIIDNTNDNLYIGSTCCSLKRRLSVHKSHYKMFLKGLCGNVTSFDIIKNNDFEMIKIEDCNIKTKDELKARERYYIENNECLNKVIPGRSRKEYRVANKEKINEKIKEYYIDNKDKVNIKCKEYYDANKDKINEKFECVCGGKYTYCHKSHHIKSKKHQKYLEILNK